MSEEPQPEPCPKCKGGKIEFVEAGPAIRWQRDCPACGGTGLYSDSVARALSGEDQFCPIPMPEWRKQQLMNKANF